MFNRNCIILFLFFSFLSKEVYSDSTRVFRPNVSIGNDIDSSFAFSKNRWLIKVGDDLKYSGWEYDDKDWQQLESTKLLDSMYVRNRIKYHAWFRLHFYADSLDASVPLAFSIRQKGSSQIFINGKFYKEIGRYDADEDERDDGTNKVIFFTPIAGKDNVIAVRYQNKQYDYSYDNGSGRKQFGFIARLTSADRFWGEAITNFTVISIIGLGVFVFIFTIGFIHLLMYLFYRARKSNLYFSLFCFLFSYFFLHVYLSQFFLSKPVIANILTAIIVFSVPIFFLSLLSVLYSFFYEKRPKQWRIFLWLIIICSGLLLTIPTAGFALGVLVVVVVAVESIRVIIIAIKQKKKGAIVISSGFGTMALLLFYILFIAVVGAYSGNNLSLGWSDTLGKIFIILFVASVMGIPLSMSTFLAWDFAQTNKSLSKKLIEVEDLSARSIEQEKEKQKILAGQNERLERQVEERTKEINEQKKEIEEKNKDITDSINYAQRIQRSILPTEKEINEIFKDSFVLFKPRDIVSGDFYQFKKSGDYNYAIMADCTGHGVPGALMSMIGSNLLKQIILERGTKEPNKILSELHREVRSTLRQTSGVQSHDGMDASILLEYQNKLYISSANRPVYIIYNDELIELKPDKFSIGGSHSNDDLSFKVSEVNIVPGMMIYMFSDGYADQFGGEAGKKFKAKNLSQLLLSNYMKPLHTQKEILNTTFDNWKNDLEQVDDVCIIGLKF